MKVFLSYCWTNKVEADEIEKKLSSIGLSIIRDVNELSYKDNLRTFMQSIRSTDFAIILVSSDYLKSPNCLNEIIELSKDVEFDKKILPIIIDNTKIYSLQDKLEIIKYWNEECDKLKILLKTVDPEHSINLLQELKRYKAILSSIDEFLGKITASLNITYSESLKNNFKDLLKFIGFDASSIQNELIRINAISNIQERELELEKLQSQYPQSASIIFTIGYLNLNDNKNYFKAKECFENYLNNFDNRSSTAYNNLGLAYAKLKNPTQAEFYFKKGLEIDSESYTILHNLGNIEIGKKNYRAAENYFQKTISLYPFDSEAFYNLGKIYNEFDKNPDKAIVYYLRAIELEPDYYVFYNNLAGIYLAQGKNDLARELLETSLLKNPNDLIAIHNLGNLYKQVFKDNVKAKKMFRRALGLDRDYIPSKIILSIILIENNTELEEAEEMLNEVIEKDPINNVALHYLDILRSTLSKKK